MLIKINGFIFLTGNTSQNGSISAPIKPSPGNTSRPDAYIKPRANFKITSVDQGFGCTATPVGPRDQRLRNLATTPWTTPKKKYPPSVDTKSNTKSQATNTKHNTIPY